MSAAITSTKITIITIAAFSHELRFLLFSSSVILNRFPGPALNKLFKTV